MAEYKLSKKAEHDLAEIARYSLDTFGLKAAREYRNSLNSAFERLANNPDLGHPFVHKSRHTRRLMHESHAIYYRLRGRVIFIQRILHQNQDPMRRL
jgi:toxin ParE1/3/4